VVGLATVHSMSVPGSKLARMRPRKPTCSDCAGSTAKRVPTVKVSVRTVVDAGLVRGEHGLGLDGVGGGGLAGGGRERGGHAGAGLVGGAVVAVGEGERDGEGDGGGREHDDAGGLGGALVPRLRLLAGHAAEDRRELAVAGRHADAGGGGVGPAVDGLEQVVTTTTTRARAQVGQVLHLGVGV
jgi:hypothetical protein